MFLHFFLVLIIVLAFLLYPYFYSSDRTNNKVESQDIYTKIEELRKLVNVIVNHIQLSRAFTNLNDDSLKSRQRPFLLPSYEIYSSDTITRTEDQRIIRLVLWDKQSHKLYDDNTLIYATLHEIAHIMAPEEAEHGDPEFEEIEDLLLKTAMKLGYYNPHLSLPENYSCMIE